MGKYQGEDIPFPEEKSEASWQAGETDRTPLPPRKRNGTIGETGAEERDEIYTKLLNKYIEEYDRNRKQRRKMKNVFFGFTIAIFVLLIVGLITLLIVMSVNKTLSVTVGAILSATAFASIITALITLPTIVAKHLFPENMDCDIVDIVGKMIQNDCEIRKAAESKCSSSVIEK